MLSGTSVGEFGALQNKCENIVGPTSRRDGLVAPSGSSCLDIYYYNSSFVCMFVSLYECYATPLTGRCILKFAPLSPCPRTIELPYIVIMHNCRQRYANNYVQLLTASRVFSSKENARKRLCYIICANVY